MLTGEPTIRTAPGSHRRGPRSIHPADNTDSHQVRSRRFFFFVLFFSFFKLFFNFFCCLFLLFISISLIDWLMLKWTWCLVIWGYFNAQKKEKKWNKKVEEEEAKLKIEKKTFSKTNGDRRITVRMAERRHAGEGRRWKRKLDNQKEKRKKNPKPADKDRLNQLKLNDNHVETTKETRRFITTDSQSPSPHLI